MEYLSIYVRVRCLLKSHAALCKGSCSSVSLHECCWSATVTSHTLDSELLYMARKVLRSACFASSCSPAAIRDTAAGTATEGARPVARTGTVGLIFLCPFLGASLGAPANPAYMAHRVLIRPLL